MEIIAKPKQITIYRPQPAQQFDKFLKIRSQKQSIIESQSQPIRQKIQGFEELLKLTKTGSSICAQNIHKKQSNGHVKNKSQFGKNINVFGHYSNEQDLNKFQDIESDEAQLKKLNKMVHGITQWENDRQKQSFHVQRKENNPKTTKLDKSLSGTFRNEKSANELIRERKKQAYTSSDGKKFRKFYCPMPRHQGTNQMKRINSQFIKTSSHLNYPKTLLQANLLCQNKQNFKSLRKKIKQLQTRAKQEYGLKFQQNKLTSFPKSNKQFNNFTDSKDTSMQNENQELDFSDLELGPILAKQLPNRYKNYQKMRDQLDEQNRKDSSVPKNLIEVVLNKGESYHNFNIAKTNFDYDKYFSNNANKIKKGFIHRPKSFKPTYTYVRI